MSYCCREHQKSDWKSHKADCHIIKEASGKLEAEDHHLRTHSCEHGDLCTPPDPFGTSVGRFGAFAGGLVYLRARRAFIRALLTQTTKEAVELALRHSLEMLRLDHVDTAQVRRLVPALYLRLGRDQECYDFIKSWYFARQDTHFQPGAPYLIMKGEDVYEPVLFNLVEREVASPETGHVYALLLLKIRVLQDLRSLRKLEKVRIEHGYPEYPPLALNASHGRFMSSILLYDPRLTQRATDMDGLNASIADMESQTGELYTMLVKKHPHLFCKAMYSKTMDCECADCLLAEPCRCQDCISAGLAIKQCKACNDLAIMVQENSQAWSETVGTANVLYELCEKDSSSHIAITMAQMMATDQYKLAVRSFEEQKLKGLRI